MEEAKTKREAIEEAKEHKSRFTRRLENKKKALLEGYVLEFFTKRSALKDPESEAAGVIFDYYNTLWQTECKNFNVKRNPFKLRYEAFTESVEYYLKMEKTQVKQTEESNKIKNFNHWFRRAHVARTRPLITLWFHIKSLFNHEKYILLWKKFYVDVFNKNI